jgi:hypothetical protein
MALCIVGLLYLTAALFNLKVPDTGWITRSLKNPVYLLHDFNHCLKLLWRDKLGQISSPPPRCSGAPARRCSSS